MEPYIKSFGPALIVALGVIASLGAALHYVLWGDEPAPEEKDWHPSRHYRGGK